MHNSEDGHGLEDSPDFRETEYAAGQEVWVQTGPPLTANVAGLLGEVVSVANDGKVTVRFNPSISSISTELVIESKVLYGWQKKYGKIR